MTRKAARQRLRLLDKLLGMIRPLIDHLGPALARRPAAPIGAATGYRLIVDHLYAELRALERRLTEAESTYVEDQRRFAELKSERDQARTDLRRKQSQLRQILAAFYGPGEVASAGIGRALSKSSPEFLSQVTRTVRTLRDLETLGPPIVDLSFDAQAIAADLEAGLRRIEAAVAALETTRAAIDVSRSAANRVIAEVDRVAPPIGRCLSGLCELAGEREQARRIGDQ